MAVRLTCAALGAALLAMPALAQSSPPPNVPVLHSSALPGVDILPTDARAKPLKRELCGANPCRHGISTRLKIQGAPDYVIQNDFGGPYLFKGAIFIFPGETLNFEAEMGPSGPNDLTYVTAAKHPERTITVKLEQPADLANGYGVRLTVTNPFSQALAFNVMQVQPTGAADVAPGVCPAAPHGVSRKNWLLPISEVVISSLGFVSNDDAYSCAR
jgi:hypothetical protein